jgi:predicted dehydrogenase
MKIGVVGYGSIGQRHANNLRGLGHDVHVFDPAFLLGSNFGREVELYNSDVEAVVIATPTPFHEGPLRACIERGKHVLIEKPISTGVGMLPQLLDEADRKNLVVMVGNNLRFHPAIQRSKVSIDAGAFGKPIWAQFTCAQKNDKYRDSVVLNWGAHEVDTAVFLLGPVKVVLCASVAGDPGTENIADFVLLHESGARSSFHLDYVTEVEIREAWIACEHHNIGMDLPHRTLSLGHHVERLGGSYDDDYVKEVEAFVDRIQNKVVPGATGRQGLEVLRVLERVRREAGVL